MSIIPSNILTHNVSIRRFTSFIVDPKSISGSVSISRQSLISVFLEITLLGNTYSSGQIVINSSEVILFAGDTCKVSVNQYSSISSIIVTGISGGSIKIRAVNAAGELINQQIVVNGAATVRYYNNMAWVREQVQGQQVVSKRLGCGLMALPTEDLQPNDYIYFSNTLVGVTLMKVNFVEAIPDFAGLTHHLEASLIPV